jgi:hypothetical protein
LQNSQYTYYGAGLLSEHDRFPEHQAFVQEQYGFAGIDFGPPQSSLITSMLTVETDSANAADSTELTATVCNNISQHSLGATDESPTICRTSQKPPVWTGVDDKAGPSPQQLVALSPAAVVVTSATT